MANVGDVEDSMIGGSLESVCAAAAGARNRENMKGESLIGGEDANWRNCSSREDENGRKNGMARKWL